MPARLLLVLTLLSFASLSCSRKHELAGPVRHYPFSGKIVALDGAHQTATIDGAAVPNFMEAMTMEYPIESKDEFRSLRVGDKITATVNVSASGDEYNLSEVRKQPPAK